MIPLDRSTFQARGRYRAVAAVSLVVAVIVGHLVCAAPARATVKFDFEQKFFVHPHRQVWDFCVVRPDTVYHIFYHTILETTPNPAQADTIWHATSFDLKHWTVEGPVLTVGPEAHDAEAMWAPEVVYDPASASWAMLYTGVDDNMNQRACLAWSPDLYQWSKSPENPVLSPDPEIYHWSADGNWSDFRDPFLFFADGVWNMLNTAVRRGDNDRQVGVLHRATSVDLVNWTAVDDMFVNDGLNPHRVLESCQYLVRDGWHHLYFGEFDVYGITHLSAHDPAEWTMADRHIIDWGNAPDIAQFDPDIDILGRIAAHRNPATDLLMYSVRFDTLVYENDGALPDTYQPHPLDLEWASRLGTATNGNPCYGDNTAMRGDDSCGLVGHGWFGSKEYYQGPLSAYGAPGGFLGDEALGVLTSHPFYVVGNRLNLLVGGGHYPETCYVALMDAEADTILFSETGDDHETMTPRQWNLAPLEGRLVYLQIVDQETGPFGHINVDEIVEWTLDTTAVDSPLPDARSVIDRGPSPNPFNPATQFRFRLNRPGTYRLRVHDLRGRVLWSSRPTAGSVGEYRVTWSGSRSDGSPLASGVYLYTIALDGQVVSSGKLSLLK